MPCLRDVSWEDIFKLSAFDAASEFCGWFRLELMYISLIESIRSSIKVSCAAAIRLYQKDKSSESKVKFRQASNRCKRVLEAAKLAYGNKTKESITSQKLGSPDFWRIANSVLNKGKSAISPLFNGPEVLSSVVLLLLELQHLIYTRLSTVFGMLVFFTNLRLMEYQALHFSYYTLITFLMMLPVILLSVLIILLSILRVIRHLICGNNLNWLLNLNLI